MAALRSTWILAVTALLWTQPLSTIAKGKPTVLARCASAPDSAAIDPTSVASIQAATRKAPPIVRALGREQRESFKRLLAQGANANECVLGSSLLAVSAVSGDLEEMELLLNAGAGPDKPLDDGGGTPLLAALANARWDASRLLLRRGANARLTTDGGLTGLHELAVARAMKPDSDRADQLSVAEELLRRGISIDARAGVSRDTSLMLAAVAGNLELVSLLLAHGADPSIQNKRGETAATLARRQNFTGIAQLLDEAAARRPVR